MSIIVFQHSPENRPGRIGRTLRDHAFRLDIRRLDAGDAVPPDLDNVTAVVSLGGPQNVGDDVPWMQPELEFLREAHERRLPVLGVCLGAQMIAAALGGEVAPMDKPEIGFHTVSINPAGQVETMLAGIPWETPQFCHHGREVKTLPPGATLLASSSGCRAHVFKAGLRTYAFQAHVEADREIASAIFRASQDVNERAGVDQATFDRQADEHYERFARACDRLCVNLVTFLTPAWTRVGV